MNDSEFARVVAEAIVLRIVRNMPPNYFRNAESITKEAVDEARKITNALARELPCH